MPGLKSELDLANKIKTEAIVPITNTVNPPALTSASTTINENKQIIAANQEKTVKINKNTTPKNNPQKENTRPDYAPLTAGTPAEAITKLDKLNTQLNTTDNELFDFNSYQNQQAQTLRIEADAKINDAIAQQKKLKEIIGVSKQEIGNTTSVKNNTLSSQQLTKEGDDLAIKAQKLRTEAGKLTGAPKETKLNQAKKLEAKANETYIEAVEVTKTSNKSIFDLNQENIQQFVAENKSPANEVEEAKQLNEEAITAFKKANEIRQEASALPTAGAKLGNLSNAEEIEAAALLKQQQAVELLKKSNPDLALKSAATATNQTKANETTADFNSKLPDRK